jgi:regulator of replication initiation timing
LCYFSIICFFVYGEEDKPTIEVLVDNPSRSYPYTVYVYPYAIDGECRYTDKIIEEIYDVLREFPRIIIRFVDEYPEYRKLVLIDFINASNPDGAMVKFKVVNYTVQNYTGLTKYLENGRSEILILCDAYRRWGSYVVWGTAMHELLHALGLGHAGKPSTDDGFPELMHPGQYLRGEKTYPSTLDLYALYQLHFLEHGGGKLITLPESMEYKMVFPYSHDINTLTNKLKNAEITIKSLQDSLESTRSTLSDYIVSYNILWLENRDLRNNLTRLYRACNQSISLLVSKLNQTYNDYANLTSRYNWLVETYNNLYQDYQTLREESNDLQQRLYLIGIIAYASLSILLFAYLRVARKYNKLLDEYNKLIEYLGVEKHGGKE